MPACLNALWLAILIVGISFSDPMARILRGIAAALFPAAAFFAVTASPEQAPREWIYLYVALLVVACLVIAVWRRSRLFLYGFGGTAAVILYAGFVTVFRRATGVLGREAMTAFVWSLGMLLLAFLISRQKARWLPRRMFPGSPNGNGDGTAIAVDPPKPANGLTPEAMP